MNKEGTRTKTTVRSKTAATVKNGDNIKPSSKLTEKEIAVRKIKKYATTSNFGFNTRSAFSGSGYSSGGTSESSQGNFYSPQLSTDFLEKPQNLRERRAWYRNFYNSNEFVGQAIDLHSTLPLSKIRLEKPHGDNQEQIDYVYEYFLEMCSEIKLFKTLLEISHEYHLLGNCMTYAEDHNPYEVAEGDKAGEAKVAEMKEWGKKEAERLFKEFKIIDKDPNYKGWRKLIILPPDQVRIKKIPFSDESLIEFIPDPETRKSILSAQDPAYFPLSPEEESSMPRLPKSLSRDLQQNGSIPLDTDPYSGSYVYHMARKKSQYETLGVSILERCINSLLLQDKLRQAQTQIATRHMTPIRVVWAEELSDVDIENLREQVDTALVDPDFSIIANYEVHWEEMGSNGRLLELSSEYEHIENSLFAGLGVTREILTGEGTYAGNKMTLEILNTQYLLFRELLQEYVEDYLFKPVAKKKGFVEKDKYGREKLIYPRLSFTRLAIKDNDTFFDQAMQLYNKGSISIDVILEMLNIDPISTRKKIEADLFTVNDFAFNQLMANVYNAAGQALVERYTVADRLAEYMNLDPLPPPPAGEEDSGLGGGLGGGGGMGRFSSAGLDSKKQAALTKLISVVMKNPEKLDRIVDYLSKG
jgi:hypothetical protein